MIRRRSRSRALLARIDVTRSRLSARDACWEAVISVTRAPMRCLLTCLGTVLGVAAVIATIGIADSARGAVSSAFSILRSTEVTFSSTDPPSGAQALSAASEKSLDRLHGVSSAGLMWDLNGGQSLGVRRTVAPDPTGESTVSLPVTVATPGALATMDAELSSGRLYDAGMEHRHDPVALLGAAAASQLGISQVDRSPVIYIGSMQLTVIGIVTRTTMTSEVLQSIIIPPSLASYVADPAGSRELIVRTAPGAAQLIARQGPYALDPLHPGQIEAEAPPSPDLLRNQVQSSVTSLILALALLAIGVVAIASTTLLSVIQRTAEIGLRRAMGAAPRHIAALILGEAAVTGTIGGIIGASAGVLVVAGAAAAKGWAPVLDPAVIMTAPLLGTLAGLLGGAYPAWRASHITPMKALQR